MIAGYRFPLNDERLLKLLDLVHAGFHLVDMSGGLLNQMPFLRFFAPSLSGYNSLQGIVDEMIEFLKVSQICLITTSWLMFIVNLLLTH